MKHLHTSILTMVLCAGLGGFSLAEGGEAPKNPVVFWELACHDAEKSVEFFEKVFEWKTEMIPNTIIHLAKTRQQEGGIDGGIFTLQKAKAKLVEESGGLIVIEPRESGPGTRICLFNDPSGVIFAMLEQTKTEE